MCDCLSKSSKCCKMVSYINIFFVFNSFGCYLIIRFHLINCDWCLSLHLTHIEFLHIKLGTDYRIWNFTSIWRFVSWNWLSLKVLTLNMLIKSPPGSSSVKKDGRYGKVARSISVKIVLSSFILVSYFAVKNTNCLILCYRIL